MSYLKTVYLYNELKYKIKDDATGGKKKKSWDFITTYMKKFFFKNHPNFKYCLVLHF